MRITLGRISTAESGRSLRQPGGLGDVLVSQVGSEILTTVFEENIDPEGVVVLQILELGLRTS